MIPDGGIYETEGRGKEERVGKKVGAAEVVESIERGKRRVMEIWKGRET